MTKVEDIVTDIGNTRLTPCSLIVEDPPAFQGTALSVFPSLESHDLAHFVAKVKSGSPEDPCPPMVFKTIIPVFEAEVLSLLNLSLATRRVPQKFKEALVIPLLKKAGADTKILKNFRPISRLPFLAKVLEQHVL